MLARDDPISRTEVPMSPTASSATRLADAAPPHPVRALDTEVVGLERATHDIMVVRLAPPEGAEFAYSAGQYARVAFDGETERDYSLASRPAEPVLEFHIRDIGGGPSRYVAQALRLGDRVPVRGPFGDAWLRAGRGGPIAAVGGGSGLGQMRAIVGEALALGLTQPIHLYFGARAERDVYLEAEMAELAARHPNFRFVPVLSHPAGPTARRTGLIHEAIAADAPDLAGGTGYLAGPPPMVEAASAALAEFGIAPGDLHADAFIGEAERRARDGAA
jgi:CDP-4-dehydro-6-deoxyglucose reductase/ferredoxin-NAD(P)+ reductase (naphthalene dioxygenase ferredoxin-specific)